MMAEAVSPRLNSSCAAPTLSENITEDIVSAHWEIHRLERWRSIMICDRASEHKKEHNGKRLSQDKIMAFAYRRTSVSVQYYEDRM